MLFQDITTEENFYAAWEKVRGNLGAPGIDRVSIEDFEKNLHDNLALLRALVAEGAYQPLPYLTFTHKKESGKERTLRIPTVRDRVVQQAILLVIQPVFEKIFLQCSYAYRPGKSSLQAIERVERNLKRGRVWVVDADIENFFDEIDQQLLSERLAETILEKPLLKLLEQCIKSSSGSGQDAVAGGSGSGQSTGTLPTATATAPATDGKGIAQGMVLAPLLSNIYLHPLDNRMIRAQWNYIRYSDNILILSQSEEEAKSAFARAEEAIHDIRLKFNPDKTSVRHLHDGFSFLGFYFDERGKRPDEPAVRRLNERVGAALQQAAEYSETQLRDKIESIVRGWLSYFRLAGSDRAELLNRLEQELGGDENSLPRRILQAALAYQLGDRARAAKTLRTSPTATSEDPDVNYQWGLLCDLSGMQGEALDSYLSAFRLNPQHPDAACRLGLYYLSRHQNEPAIRYLQKAVQITPRNAAAHFALGAALQNLSLHGAARKAFQRATQLDPKMRKLINSLPAPHAPRSSLDASPPSPGGESLAAKQEDLQLFLRLFSGREGVFARQWLSDDGKLGYMPVYQAISEKDIKAHLAGQQTLGYYLMRSDNSVLQLVFDLDITRQVREEVAIRADDLAEWRKLLWTDAARLRDALLEAGMKCYPEDSGYKGLHVWVFFAEPVPARDVLIFAKKILAAAGSPPPGLHREVFPKEPRVAPQALGSMVKLPLGVHKLTNRRCWFLDNSGQPFPDQLAFLHTIEAVSLSIFRDALEKLKTPRPAAPPQASPAEREALEKIYKGCNVLRHLKEKSERTKWLGHVERLTVLGALAQLGPAGHQAIHEIISHTTNYNHRITEKFIQRAKGFPLSCPKIRERHSDITPVVGCCCQFKQIKNSYPSPVLHADPQFIVKIKAREAAKSGGSGQRAVAGGRGSSSGRGQSAAVGSGSSRGSGQLAVDSGSQQSKVQLPTAAAASSKAPPPTAPATATAPATTSPAAVPEVKQLLLTYLKLKKEQRHVQQQILQIEEQLNALCARYKTDRFTTELGTLKRITVEGEVKWVIEV